MYFHLKPKSEEVYYVGVGHGNRAYSVKPARNPFWKAVYDKHGIDVVIMHDDLSLSEAFQLERAYIISIGRRDLGTGTLTNLTDGGDGLTNPSLKTRTKMSEKASISGIRRFQNPIERERASANMAKMWNRLSPEEREDRIRRVQASFTPEVCAKIVEKIKLHYSNPMNREAHSVRMKRSWDGNSNRKAALADRSTKYWTPEHRKEQSEKIIKFYSDEENRKMISEHTKTQWQNPEVRKKRSDGIRKRWTDPEYRRKQSERQKAYWKKKRSTQ